VEFAQIAKIFHMKSNVKEIADVCGRMEHAIGMIFIKISWIQENPKHVKRNWHINAKDMTTMMRTFSVSMKKIKKNAHRFR
jgi:hypothetical protein